MKVSSLFSTVVVLLFFNFCTVSEKSKNAPLKVREVVDTVGFAHLAWQMDSVEKRISSEFSNELANAAQPKNVIWRAAICPHDDYTYASWLYPAVLKNIKSKTVIIFGVAHKAKNFNLENKIVFDSFDAWKGPFGNVEISPLREKIMENMPEDLFLVHDSMQMVEHSIESMIPFLQKQNNEVEIIPILVPYMSLSQMDTISKSFAAALQKIASTEKLKWGKDFSILITTDAVHYGDEDWGGKNYAPFGSDSVGYTKAVAHENEIISTCFSGELSDEKANQFYHYTVQYDNFREYKWTWCGRYSVPFGLKVANQLQHLTNTEPLQSVPLGYETSISHSELPVNDLHMGKTAVATPNHWVGYVSVGFQ